MVIVTGTKRSGTSMWMQILAAAGLPMLGDEFPERFSRLTDANPAGFWESRLRRGVYFATNPDPATRVYLHPDDTRLHALKVFVPGLVRTDQAFLYRVIATVRPWREYVTSMRRLHDLEDEALLDDSADVVDRREARRGRVPPELQWWRELFVLLRDRATRRYPFHLVTYDRLLEDPDREIRRVLDWIGEGDPEPAIAAVRPELRTQDTPEVDTDVVDAEAIALFDALYGALHADEELSGDLIRALNALDARLREEPSTGG